MLQCSRWVNEWNPPWATARAAVWAQWLIAAMHGWRGVRGWVAKQSADKFKHSQFFLYQENGDCGHHQTISHCWISDWQLLDLWELEVRTAVTDAVIVVLTFATLLKNKNHNRRSQNNNVKKKKSQLIEKRLLCRCRRATLLQRRDSIMALSSFYYPQKKPAFILKNAQQFKAILCRQTQSQRVCFLLVVVFWFPQREGKTPSFLSLPITKKNPLKHPKSCICSAPSLTSLVKWLKMSQRKRTPSVEHQGKSVSVQPVASIQVCVEFSLLLWRKYQRQIAFIVCSCLCARVTLFPPSRGLPRHCWVPGQPLRSQTACWWSAAGRRSSAPWAWAPHTPSAASPGCSSPPSPEGTARYLKHGERKVRIRASDLNMSLVQTERQSYLNL